ncbi:MAG: M23 family metallopeptidase [Candidatus Diapherotrites archaeon]
MDFKDSSNAKGSAKRFEEFENFVEIRHGNEYSYYGHIQKGSARVKVGQKVKSGQTIAKVGRTGWMANLPEPHVHFMVGKYFMKTIPIRFKK